MLEGKEFEGKIGDVGSYYVDVDAAGKVTLGMVISKAGNGFMMSSENKAEVTLVSLLEEYAKKSPAKWDDAAVETLKKVLALVG
jgi:hypothetical protein